MPAIRYTPQFIERQYVPLNDIGLIGNIMGDKQKKHDMAMALQNEALEKAYGIELGSPLNIPERDRIIKELETNIEQAIANRGGDPANAVQDIARTIVGSRKEPFWTLNAQQAKERELLSRMRASNPGLMVLRDPGDIAVSKGMSPEDLNFVVHDPDNIQKLIDRDTALMARHQLDLGLSRDKFNTIKQLTRLGLSREEFNNMVGPEWTKTMDRYLSIIPEKARNIILKDPQLYNQVQDQIIGGLEPAILGNRADYSFIPRTGTTDSGSGYMPSGSDYNVLGEADTRTNKTIERDRERLNSIFNQDGSLNSSAQTTRYIVFSPNPDVPDEMEPVTSKEEFEEKVNKFRQMGYQVKTTDYDSAQAGTPDYKKYKELVDNYGNIYDNVIKNGGTQRDAVNQILDLQKSETLKGNLEHSLGVKGMGQALLNKINMSNDKVFIPINDKGVPEDEKKGISYEKLYKEEFGGNQGMLDDIVPYIDQNGNLVFNSIKGNRFTVNRNHLPTNTKVFLDAFKAIKGTFNNYQFTTEDVNKINNGEDIKGFVPTYYMGNGDVIAVKMDNTDSGLPDVRNKSIYYYNAKDKKKYLIGQGDNISGFTEFMRNLISASLVSPGMKDYKVDFNNMTIVPIF